MKNCLIKNNLLLIFNAMIAGCTTSITMLSSNDLIFHRMKRITQILPALGR